MSKEDNSVKNFRERFRDFPNQLVIELLSGDDFASRLAREAFPKERGKRGRYLPIEVLTTIYDALISQEIDRLWSEIEIDKSMAVNGIQIYKIHGLTGQEYHKAICQWKESVMTCYESSPDWQFVKREMLELDDLWTFNRKGQEKSDFFGCLLKEIVKDRFPNLPTKGITVQRLAGIARKFK